MQNTDLLIDIGVNFHSSQLAGLTATLLARAKEAGVTRILATGTSLKSSQQALDLARAEPGTVYATAGVHPHSAKDWSPAVAAALRGMLADPAVVAVGECGLDYHRDFSPRDVQRAVFEAQLQSAIDTNKPLFLHCRDAFTDFHALLAPAVQAGAHGVVHCFTGNRAEAEAFIEMGLDIGITGWVTDLKRGTDLRDAVAHIPLARLHLETDAPYLGPKNTTHRRPYNEPANLPYVAQAVAALKQLPVSDVIRQCTQNSERLFRLS